MLLCVQLEFITISFVVVFSSRRKRPSTFFVVVWIFRNMMNWNKFVRNVVMRTVCVIRLMCVCVRANACGHSNCRSGSLWTCTKYLPNELLVLSIWRQRRRRRRRRRRRNSSICVPPLRHLSPAAIIITIQQFLLDILLVKQAFCTHNRFVIWPPSSRHRAVDVH